MKKEDFRGISRDLLDSIGFKEEFGDYLFPILDVYGNKVGKLINFKEPQEGGIKYFKTYKKQGIFFAEPFLKHLWYGKPIVICEGPYDALSLIQSKIKCVASLSPTLTWGQLKKLRRYTNKIVLWPDSDDSGDVGVKETLKKLRQYPEMRVRIFECNEAKDANELLVKNTREYFTERVKKITKMIETFK